MDHKTKPMQKYKSQQDFIYFFLASVKLWLRKTYTDPTQGRLHGGNNKQHFVVKV